MAYKWLKLHLSWYETPSHANLSPEARHLGPFLLVLASREWRGESPWAGLIRWGRPLNKDQISSESWFSVEVVGRVLEELRKAGTLELRGDCWGFPNFGAFQSHPESGSYLPIEEENRSEEIRLELTKGAISEQVSALWDLQEALRKEHSPAARKRKLTPARRSMVAARLREDGYEACEAVLRAYAETAPDWLNGETNWRPKNFTRTLGMVGTRKAGLQVVPRASEYAEPGVYDSAGNRVGGGA